MKKGKYLLLFLLVTGLFISCSSDDDDPIIPEEYEAAMLSFGFYEEDNSEVIFQDYIVETVAGTSINLSLPEEVDKSNLIARFTTTENDVVKVGGTVQQSGVTANDFSAPVDYIVSEGTENVKYTVTVGVAPAFVWSALPPFAADSARAVTMKVNPTNGNPYFLYQLDREEADDRGAALLTFKDGSWNDLGQASDGRIGSYMDITFNSKGVPYISYQDYTNGNREITVNKYSNSSWSVVGQKGVGSGRSSYQTLSFVNDDKLLLAATHDRGGVLARRELSIHFFENNSWTVDQTIPDRSADLTSYNAVSVKQGDAVFVASYNPVSEDNSISVHKYSNNAWGTVIDKWADPEATGISYRGLDMDVDKDGNVYVVFVDNSSAGEQRLRVIKYNSSSKEVENVGNKIVSAVGGYERFAMSVSPFGVPYIVYRDESNFPAVVNFDKDLQDWTNPQILESSDVDELSIDFAANGVGYVSYKKGNIIVAHKYASPE